jgi:hypothetical protein
MKKKGHSSIKFDFDTMKWRGISIEQIQIWERIYPDVNVIKVLQFDTIRWIDRNKEKKISHKSRWRTFICNWLQAEQEKNIGR